MEQIEYKKWTIDHVYDCSKGYDEIDYYNVWTPDGLDLASDQFKTIDEAKAWIDEQIKGGYNENRRTI
tara:strand:+ start:78 stop:281 length:204 start_codon:yes stop_codon:yes gene_type:complete